ncbi:DUF4326 domain-containing protein [Streptomyces cucumeris]|uniref:DUF4326 domain-containing protein n=1 Tax=Streptomyces cucumeris TaxID=2962890 RepID=UPI003D765EF3
MPRTTVVNLKGHRDDPAYADVVYVGRAMHRGAHLLARPDLLALLPALRGRRLGCWCAPLPCQAEIIAELADQG